MGRSVTQPDWHVLNQRYLVAALDVLRACLQTRLAAGKRVKTAKARQRALPEQLQTAMADAGLPPPALVAVRERFGLSAFEQDILLLCAGMELDAGFAALVAELQGAPSRRVATFGLALAVLPDPHWSALLPDGPLRKHDLIELQPAPQPDSAPVTSAPLIARESVLHYLTGASPVLDDRLAALAHPITTRATWDDLVLPDEQLELLHELASQMRQRRKVYVEWGFAEKNARGLGMSALFSGPSGTGKTLAAEVLANELGLALFRIDLSSVVSKYIGETEKNLRRVFEAAENVDAVLLFDEADALFGKRSEVKDSHDRYANIEVGFLLQQMEAYRGLAILTTNLKHAIDPAFLRRIRFAVQFPFPDAEHRERIWRRAFPPRAPLNGVSFEHLAQLNVAGGNIRNIALNAAFLAADADVKIGMAHALKAARGEYAKLERPLSGVEMEVWEERAASGKVKEASNVA